MIFAPAALAFGRISIICDEVDLFDVLQHHESELPFALICLSFGNSELDDERRCAEFAYDRMRRWKISLTIWRASLRWRKRSSVLAVFNARFYVRVRRFDEPS